MFSKKHCHLSVSKGEQCVNRALVRLRQSAAMRCVVIFFFIVILVPSGWFIMVSQNDREDGGERRLWALELMPEPWPFLTILW